MTATSSLRTRIDALTSGGARATPELAAQLAREVPFRGPPSARGAERAQLSGRLPDWLRGKIVRVAPSFAVTPNWSAAHWFDALGVAIGIELGSGSHVSLTWAALDCAMGAAAVSGKVPLGQFASPNQRGLLATLLGPIPEQTDNTNVNVVRMGRDLVALTETNHQLLLDDATLQVRGRVHYDDKLGTPMMLAHPIVYGDKLTNLATHFKPRAEVTLYEQHGSERVRRPRATWRTSDMPYIHSFGLTEQSGIVIDHPLRVRTAKLLWSNRGLIDHYTWKPETGTRLVVLDLHDGSSRVHETDALFCFHTVHAFETADATHLDLIAYKDASIIDALSVARLRDGLPNAHAQLLRLRIDRKSGVVTRRPLADTTLEFPQVDWDFVGTGEQRFVYGVLLKRDGATTRGDILKVDISNGEIKRFSDGDFTLGEPVFVGAPGRRNEGEGVLLSVGASQRGAALFVLDATTLDLLARAEFEAPLPLGFHGCFVPASKA